MYRKGFAVLWIAALAAAAAASASGATPHFRETFFIGGDYAEDGEGGHIIQGQMYVEHLTPASSYEPQPYPIIFIHGATRTGNVSRRTLIPMPRRRTPILCDTIR